MATVTPPLRPLAEPPTPRHGAKFDSYEPYPLRRSSRLRSLRTPSPGAPETSPFGASSASSRVTHHSHHLSPPSSPMSPQNPISRKRNRQGAAKLPSSTHLVETKPKEEGMLPTPTKTPQKKDLKRNLKPASRVLFPRDLRNDDPMPKRRARFSLDSPGPEPEIEIYTDSKDRVPEKDESENNPFYDSTTKRVKSKRKAKEPDYNNEVRDVLDHDEGMIYVFRGRKVYKKFDPEDDDVPPDGTDLADLPFAGIPTAPRRFTRSSVKPRFLFPDAYGKHGNSTDEEAVTDIEEPQTREVEIEEPTESKGKVAATPSKQKYYATPPTTARTTRATVKRTTQDQAEEEDDLPASLFTVRKAKRGSPFDGWSRTKAGESSIGQTRKRDAESPLLEEAAKRARVST